MIYEDQLLDTPDLQNYGRRDGVVRVADPLQEGSSPRVTPGQAS